ncbi:DMT family transporter [Aliidiomarina celeris]|uniref:DMT family transporter n=1 Tax=Aliidiomarina celeris TaxID=2249428 RepID=UPI000DE810A9|nr:DMT family transporter [Aliidiomarina celeris]
MSLYFGQLAALLAAFLWAVATLFYSKSSHHLSSIQLNLVKGLVATPLLLLGIMLLPSATGAGWQLPIFLLMTLSGIIGITLGDSFYFSALRRLGPAHAVLFEYLAPPLAAVIAWLVLAETISLLQGIAATVVITGVMIVLTERQTLGKAPLSRSGIFFGIGAALCQAVGLVMAFYAFQQTNVAPAEAAFVRILGGTLALTLGILIVKPCLLRSTYQGLQQTHLATLFTAIVFGTFCAIWLQQIAVAHVTPGIAQTLLSTAPLFILAIHAAQGKRVSLRAVSGTLFAMLGIVALFA